MSQLSITAILAYLIVIFVGIGLHEFAHCKMADAAGDPTPRLFGRVTLNLFKHFDPLGVVFILITTFTGFGIGWGKPAPMNPSKMNNPRWDFFMAVAAGPLSNVLQACIYAITFRTILTFAPAIAQIEFIYALLLFGVIANIGLFLFNLIPLGVLDGHYLVGLLLPENLRIKWFNFNRSIGSFMFIGLILGDQLLSSALGFSLFGSLIATPAQKITSFLIGVNPF